MSEGQMPPLSFWERVGRVAAFLLATGMTVLAVLTLAGVVAWTNNAGEPAHTTFERIVLGVFYTLVGLLSMAAAIFRFPEETNSRPRRSRRASGRFGIDVN